MAEVIQVDYDQLSQVAAKFATESQNVAELLQKVRAGMQSLEDGGWIGRGADSFFAEMDGVLLPAVQRLERALDQASQNAGRISQQMRQAEEDAQGLFNG